MSPLSQSISSNDGTSGAIGKSLREARLAASLTLRELAARAGTSHATISTYETGRKVPSTQTWLRLLEACGYGIELTLHPRIRQANSVSRGDELLAVLELAEQFPARPARMLRFPSLKRLASAG